MTKVSWTLFVCVSAVLWPVGSHAQESRPERPYRGLFRGNSTDDRRAALNILLGGGYDDNVLADTGGGVGIVSPSQATGGFGRLGADLGYSQNTPRLTFGASIATDSRYFPELDSQYFGAHTGSIGVSALVGRRTRLSANQAVAYQPFLTLNLFPSPTTAVVEVAQPASQDQSTPFDDFMDYRTSIDLRQEVSRQGSLTLSYAHQFSDFTIESNNLRSQNALVRYMHEVARGVGIRVGYGYRVGDYFDADQPRTVQGHLVDAGIDYSRALSFSRRTTFSFGTGSTVLKDADATRYGLIGDARLNHEFGRTWTAAAAYARSASFVRTFNQPFFSDSIGAEVKGLLSRRVELSLNGSWALGDVGIDAGADSGFESFAATSLLTFAVSRTLALTASYGFFKYNFGVGVALPDGFASDIERQTAQIAMQLWLPLYGSRSGNASR